jgi:alkanesulfonate monooxygenase SsuD/methylene tetrahydromethanopterin reductase-like flavin-dependent oxidoreductase (luciferase family)
MQKFSLGILDFGYRKRNVPSSDILNDVIESSALAEQLGYSSFWLGEHHNSSPAWSNPEILIPIIAGLTDKIRVGVAGILLAAHSPYRVALTFKLLSSLFPDRIDLGLAAGLPQLPIVQKLLGHNSIDESWIKELNPKQKVEELVWYLNHEKEVFEKEKLTIPPVGGTLPRVWKLSASFKDLDECVRNKTHICKSLFHVKQREIYDKQKIATFKEEYFKKHNSYPEMKMAFASICESNTNSALRSFEELGLKDPAEKELYIVGTPELIKEKLYSIYEESGVSEFIIHDKLTDLKKRKKSMELLAKEFQLF